jgi:hypothetical protein
MLKRHQKLSRPTSWAFIGLVDTDRGAHLLYVTLVAAVQKVQKHFAPRNVSQPSVGLKKHGLLRQLGLI